MTAEDFPIVTAIVNMSQSTIMIIRKGLLIILHMATTLEGISIHRPTMLKTTVQDVKIHDMEPSLKEDSSVDCPLQNFWTLECSSDNHNPLYRRLIL
mmetsp:Transcript_14857/g.30573  ORF Transcript_14857/g.30573 Transcript_14857/m.30573 type:complete len:97 (-) Transcript_14857:200-490(-)